MPKRTPAQIAQSEPRLVRQERGLDKGTVQELLAAGVQKDRLALGIEIS